MSMLQKIFNGVLTLALLGILAGIVYDEIYSHPELIRDVEEQSHATEMRLLANDFRQQQLEKIVGELKTSNASLLEANRLQKEDTEDFHGMVKGNYERKKVEAAQLKQDNRQLEEEKAAQEREVETLKLKLRGAALRGGGTRTFTEDEIFFEN